MNQCIYHISKERMAPELMVLSEQAPQLSNTLVTTLHFQLRSARYTVLQTKNSTRRLQEVPLQQSSHHENMTILVHPTINYCLESVAAHFQLCSARYNVSQTKNSVRIVSAINPDTTENTDNSSLQTYCREAMHCATANRHLWLSAKRNGTQRWTKVSP